ncbi:MAG: DUF3772 domain-containing protein [Gammaproteobacteria bacterium]
MRQLLTLFLLLSLFTGLLHAQSGQQAPIDQRLADWNTRIEYSLKQIDSPELSDEKLKRLRRKLIELLDDIRSTRDEIEREAGVLGDEISALGAPPAEGEPKESPGIAKKRASLNERLSIIEGRVKETDLMLARTEKVLRQVSTIRIDRFKNKVFRRGLSAISPDVWQKALPELKEKWTAAQEQFVRWQSEESFPQQLKTTAVHSAVALVIVFALVGPLSLRIYRNYGRIPELQEPSYLELLRAASAFAFVRILSPMAVASAVYWVLDYDLKWSKGAAQIALSTLTAVLMVIVVSGVSRAMIAPMEKRWRLMPLNDDDACYIHRVIVGLAWVFAIDLVLGSWHTVSGVSLELTVLRNFLIGLLIAALLLALLVRRKLWRTDVESRKIGKAAFWRMIRGLIAVLVLMIPVSAIAGYVAFSRLLGTQIVLTGGLYILVSTVIVLGAELIDELLSKETETGMKLRKSLQLTEDGGELLAFWLKVAFNLVIFLCAVLTFLIIWGAGGEDLNEWLYTALFGFKVAGVTVSIATLFLAIVLFSGILLLTRLLQRFLEHRILPRTRMDFGIQNSIRAAVGYIGFIIAAVFAISTLGIDLTKLAIIAGALSVGIGFGLQNIVNNFVSGLILLIERPIKVGDWVVVGDKQGYVRNIKVRATEIQTFDRASVFIPNSDLISHPLLNWTHADKTGRVIVPVGVAYGTDTRRVREILLEVAAAHDLVFSSPAPSVLFKGFGDSCLNFELRAFVLDVDKVVAVSSELCFQIDAAFRQEGIEIPFPQQDIHWKDIERLEKLVERILTEKNRVPVEQSRPGK